MDIDKCTDKETYYYSYNVKFWPSQDWASETQVFEREFTEIQKSNFTVFDTPHYCGGRNVQKNERDHMFENYAKGYAKVCDQMPNEFFQSMILFYKTFIGEANLTWNLILLPHQLSWGYTPEQKIIMIAETKKEKFAEHRDMSFELNYEQQ